MSWAKSILGLGGCLSVPARSKVHALLRRVSELWGCSEITKHSIG